MFGPRSTLFKALTLAALCAPLARAQTRSSPIQTCGLGPIQHIDRLPDGIRIRTTHGLVPVDGVVDLAASFDTVGWFARESQTLRRVGEVLLPAAPAFVPTRLLIADDAFAFAGPEVSAALADAVDRLKATFIHHRHIQVYTGDPAAWSGIFRVVQGTEIWRRHGAWIDAHRPNFGPGIAERFRWTRTIDPAEAERMRPRSGLRLR